MIQSRVLQQNTQETLLLFKEKKEARIPKNEKREKKIKKNFVAIFNRFKFYGKLFLCQ